MKQSAHVVTMQRARGNPDALLMGPLCFKHNLIWENYSLHTHDCYELELVDEGEGEQWINGSPFPLAPGSIFLLSPDDFHRFRTDGPLRFLTIKLSASPLPQPISALLAECVGGVFAQLGAQDYREAADYFHRIEHELLEKGPYAVQRVYAWLTLLLTRLFGVAQRVETPADTQPVMRHIVRSIQYIDTHFCSPITLEQVAAHCNLTSCYFSSIFSQHVGCCFSKYLADKRVSHAQRMLRTTDESITGIAFSCGFGSISNFQRTFKRLSGTAPSAYRRW